MAAFFGTERTPLSGGNSKHSRSDTLSKFLYIENKYGKRHAIWKLYDETKPKALAEDKPPILTTFRKGSPGFLITIHSSDFEEVLKACKEAGLFPTLFTPTQNLPPKDA